MPWGLLGQGAVETGLTLSRCLSRAASVLPGAASSVLDGASSKIRSVTPKDWSKGSNLRMRILRRNSQLFLACLLLATVWYGAVVEVVHSHGPVSSKQSRDTFAYETRGPQSSQSLRSLHSECSMCQFQRQLFGGFVHAVLPSHSLEHVVCYSPASEIYFSTSTAPTSGRAPPLA